MVAGPTPYIACTGSGCRKPTTPSDRTSISPSGFACRDAILAMNLLGPMPTEQVICCSSATTARRCSPIAEGAPNIRTEPVTSRYASSIEAASTTEETERNTATMAFDTAV